LRRDEPREGHEAGERGGARHDQPLSARSPADVEQGGKQDRRHLQEGRHHRERIRERSLEVARERGGRAADDGGVVDAEPVGRRQDRTAEAFQLERTARLRVETLPQAVPANDRERHERDRDHSAERGERTREPWPRREAEEREQRDGVELRRHGEAEKRETQRRARVEQRAYGRGDEQRRPDVVRVQRDGAERERREREHGQRPVEPPRPHV